MENNRPDAVKIAKATVANKEKDSEKAKESSSVQAVIDDLVKKADQAQLKFMEFNQARIDAIVKAMTMAGIEKHMELARMAHEETEMGVYEDKVTKNLFATEYVYHDIKGDKTVGIIEENPEEGYVKIAEPIGIIAGVTPVTNPTSTTMFKCLIAMKTRNPIIFSFHPKSIRSSIAAARTMRDAAIAAGAPENCIAWIEEPSVEATNLLMKHPGISMILATGGSGMVGAAYSSGKPALGVGPGNVPCYIEKTANLRRAVSDLILSKTFDNGMICASEQAVIIDRDVAGEVKQIMTEYGCYFLKPDEIAALSKVAIDEKRGSMSPDVVGQPAAKIAAMAGIKVAPDTKILVAELQGVGPEYPLSREKLSPILACYVVADYKEGIRRCQEMTEFGGLGHSAVIHSTNQAVIDEFAAKVRTGRLLVNSPSSQGAIGDLYNSNTPSLTLGCGSMGGNSTTDNVSVGNLINVKRVAHRKDRMKWFKIPQKVYFEYGSLQYLSKMKGKKAFIVTDPFMVKLGFVEKVIYQLEKIPMEYQIFSDVEPDPSVETVHKGCAEMNKFGPDIIVALGGGSAIDAAKGMWLFYENPEIEFESLRQKFADIRKRAFKFPQLGKRATFVAIPTTSGTGSEVTAFAVITDKVKNIKYPLADYELTPDIAIIDPELVLSVPQSVTADTGMDVLTHAIEAYVSVMASDYTDALAEKAIKTVFEFLPRAYRDGQDKLAREKMHNASCMAGMAFTNAFLGVNHSMAHILGGKFHIPHGRANAILLPYVIKYNAQRPTKFPAFPQYEYPQAGERYAEIARLLGLPAGTTEEGVNSLVKAIQELMDQLNIPKTLSQAGVSHEAFERELREMSDIAFNDQCTGTNPRMPLVKEIEAVYREAFDGGEVKLPAKKVKEPALV
ncbi:acetaldehyde dehydrogenase /alcohol dehydrogenase AdhE [Hydrogenispora ethanolica]|uniref:Aldehyde-alcohol dehydrogenase n=1 Tax=Hydrogenispora ethanolica TaxID=1082276 RepID=A0A4R1RD59_HYDET|nr:bifunctional acetaldehyde-CoA/alcohol dehydrogenase [Hydrogenispora ethanolica]TCL63794.1 acetaldehyde dehydrogenase /alcohol dehydrogenase AdhE [Hydrogenispora ethanolica]